MKPLLLLLLASGLTATALHAQDSPETAADRTELDRELFEWEKAFLNLSQENRNRFQTHLNKAREMFGQKRVFETIEELEKAREIYADSPDVENMLGACQVEFRAFDKAMEHFKRASELQPEAPSILFNIGEVYFVSKDWKKSEEVMTELLEMMETDETGGRVNQMARLVEFKLMIAKVKLGKMDEAKAMAARYDHLDDSPFHYFAEAVLAYEDGRDLDAEQSMNRAKKIFRNPQMVSPWQDTMMESNYMKSFFGSELPDEE